MLSAIDLRTIFSIAVVTLFATSCNPQADSGDTTPPDIPFAEIVDPTLRDPDSPINRFRVDMAKVEFEFPLSREDRMKISPENLQLMSQEQVDQIYGRLTAGPIPDGVYKGDLFFVKGDSVRPLTGGLKARIEEVFGGIPGRIAGKKVEAIEKIGGALWKGKVFYRDQRILRNMIEDLKAFDLLIDDPDTVQSIKIPRTSWLGYILPTTTVSLLFPAKLYCGQSLLDSRRESVIVDYFYSEDIDGYRKSMRHRGQLR